MKTNWNLPMSEIKKRSHTNYYSFPVSFQLEKWESKLVSNIMMARKVLPQNIVSVTLVPNTCMYRIFFSRTKSKPHWITCSYLVLLDDNLSCHIDQKMWLYVKQVGWSITWSGKKNIRFDPCKSIGRVWLSAAVCSLPVYKLLYKIIHQLSSQTYFMVSLSTLLP